MNLRSILEEVQPATLLAVSKGQSEEGVVALYEQGQRDFGENYVQELVDKAKALKDRCPEIRWHFIGHLQRNKVKTLLPWVSSIHSIDTFQLAEEISKNLSKATEVKTLPVFLEVNIDHEPTKTGFKPEETPQVAERVMQLSGIKLQGLMAIPSLEGGASGESFKKLKELEIRCRPYTQGQLSMGMSSDYKQALREGSTCVRLGTLLFGARHG